MANFLYISIELCRAHFYTRNEFEKLLFISKLIACLCSHYQPSFFEALIFSYVHIKFSHVYKEMPC